MAKWIKINQYQFKELKEFLEQASIWGVSDLKLEITTKGRIDE